MEQRDKLEYWHKLNIRNLKILDDPKNYHIYKKRLEKELRLFGKSSWDIQEFSYLEFSEEIDQDKFRELVRWEMKENFNKIIKDKINALKSQLEEVNHVKLTKTIDPEKSSKLTFQIEILKSLI
jgi:5-formyltetrahydrofolate cyclo-ligase